MPKLQDPHAILPNILCLKCKGSGVGDALWVVDEFNPNGYWHYEPCETCAGTGLHSSIQRIIDEHSIVVDQYNSLLERYSTLSDKVEYLYAELRQNPDSELEDKLRPLFDLVIDND